MRSGSLSSGVFVLRLIVLIATVLEGAASSATHHRGPKRIHLARLIDASRKFACKDPQSRAYNLKDLMQNLYQNPDDVVNQPIYVALKRCDSHSGCCASSELSCAPVAASIYYEELEVEIWNLGSNDTRRHWIRVEQHGKCTCEATNGTERHRLDHQSPQVIIV